MASGKLSLKGVQVWRLARLVSLISVMAGGSLAALPARAEPALKLLPVPREVRWASTLPLGHGVRVDVPDHDSEESFTRDDLRETLISRGVAVASNSSAIVIRLLRLDDPVAARLLKTAQFTFQPGTEAEGYCVIPAGNGIVIIGATSAGLFYGAQTVKQLVSGFGKSAHLHTASIRDWPALRYRGMDDDLSRGPVPTLEFQKKQIKTFAAYKLNVYSPYFENTLAYTQNPLGALPGGAMTPTEFRELCNFAKNYHVTVVPEQEAFGHLHDLLLNEKYADLAETPHGSVLAPGDARVMPLIKQWFTEIADETPGPFLHIGADETFDLGKGKTDAAVRTNGLGAVYIDYLKQVYTTLQPLHKRVLFWGDVAVNEPALVTQLPKDMIAVPWNYDLSNNGYELLILPFKQAGLETWVAPGVNNWNRVYPDANVSLLNIQGFIRDGQKLGSTGALTTAWNDDGEGLFNEDWYGVLFAAMASWQPGEASIPDYEASYGQVFHGDFTGLIDQAQRELMLAHALLRSVDDRGASDALFWVDPWSTDGQIDAVKIGPVLHELRMHAEQALILISQARNSAQLREQDALVALELGARRIDLIGMKFQLSEEISAAYERASQAETKLKDPDAVDSALYEISDTNGRCQDIRNAYSLARDLYEQAWLRENRPFWLHNVLVRYDIAIQLWTQRGNAVASALSQWHRDRSLPEAKALGIPGIYRN